MAAALPVDLALERAKNLDAFLDTPAFVGITGISDVNVSGHAVHRDASQS